MSEKEQVGLGETGFYDQDIYDGSNNKFDGYVTSIAANDEIDDEDYEPSTFSSNKRPGYTAPAALLNDIAQVFSHYHLVLSKSFLIITKLDPEVSRH